MYLAGMFIMAYNVFKTAAGQRAVEAPIPPLAPALDIRVTPLAIPVTAKGEGAAA
jgi:hypothetical protein